MTPLNEFLHLLAEKAEENCILDSKISLDELSDGNSLYAELGTGFANTTYYDKSTVRIVPVLFLCRNVDQARCLDQLSDICSYFQKLKKYPDAESFAWLNTEVAKDPTKIGRDEDGTYHYSCVLNNTLYL